MRIGYVGANATIGRSYATFRLASYGRERFRETVAFNLDSLQAILEENARAGMLFYRVPSGVIPFASHLCCDQDWERIFKARLRGIGRTIRERGFRISMHPDPFTLLNSPREDVTLASVKELDYHARFLDALGLGLDAKIQIHGGGLYGDRDAALARFGARLRRLPSRIARRLVVENDDRLFGVNDVLRLGLPVILDVFHLECLEGERNPRPALERVRKTWAARDGPPMVDYSSQEPGMRRGNHARTLDVAHFRRFLRAIRGIDVDVLLEIKDKERSAAQAVNLAGLAPRGFPAPGPRSRRAEAPSSRRGRLPRDP